MIPFTGVTPTDDALSQWGDPVATDFLHDLSPFAGGPMALIGWGASLFALLFVALDFTSGKHLRGVLKLVALAIFIAAGKGGLDPIFRAIDSLGDTPTRLIVKRAQNVGEPFADPASSFPLRQRYVADFGFRVTDHTLHAKLETAARRCLTDGVLTAVRTGQNPATELQKVHVQEGTKGTLCDAYIANLDGSLPAAGAPSKFAARRAEATVVWNILKPNQPLPDPGAERDAGARAREKAFSADPLAFFGKFFGGATVAVQVINRFLFLFLLVPQYWKVLVVYLGSMLWVRSWPLGLYVAHKASKVAVPTLQALDTDLDTSFLHTVALYDAGPAALASADAKYAGFYTSEMGSDIILMVALNLVTGAVLAYFVKVILYRK